MVLIQLSEHADIKGKNALEKRLLSAPCVQFCYEIAGPHDIVALFDCESMSAFNDAADELRQIGLSEGDITTVLAGDPSMTGHPKPGNPVPLLRSRDSGPGANANGASSSRSPESLTIVLA